MITNNCFTVEYNYATSGTASQSSTYDDRADLIAEKAIDGNISTMSITDINDESGNEWWKVDLGKIILLRKVLVYVRNGTDCGPSDDEVCCKYNNYTYWVQCESAAIKSNFLCGKCKI